jgi:hypothetical protein
MSAPHCLLNYRRSDLKPVIGVSFLVDSDEAVRC